MSGLSDIQIQVQSPGSDANARAVMNEIAGLLQDLLHRGVGGSIDLHRLPLTLEDHALLDTTLGEGEVRAEIDSLGPTIVEETAISGVWRITHYNEDEGVIADFIEVAFCPEILLSAKEDVSAGLEKIRSCLGETSKEEADHEG